VFYVGVKLGLYSWTEDVWEQRTV